MFCGPESLLGLSQIIQFCFKQQSGFHFELTPPPSIPPTQEEKVLEYTVAILFLLALVSLINKVLNPVLAGFIRWGFTVLCV